MNKNLELMIKEIVKEAVKEAVKELNITSLNTCVPNTYVPMDSDTEVGTKEIAEEKKEVEKVESTKEVNVEKENIEEGTNRRKELESKSYNELKVIIKELGGKATGKKVDIIDRILKLESTNEVKEEVEEEDKNIVEVTEDEKVEEQIVEVEDTNEEVDEEDEEDLDEYKEFLGELDKKELKQIAKKIGIKTTLKDTVEKIIEKLLMNTDALYEALEELGYIEAEEVEDEEVEETLNEEENGLVKELGLEDWTIEELADVLAEHDLSTKGKKQALIDRIVKAIEDGVIELDDEDIEEDEEEVETKSEKEDEVSVGDALVEKNLEKEIREQYKNKKLSIAKIKRFIKDYNAGEPEVVEGKSKEELLEEYIKAKKSLVDDDGALHDPEEPYVRGGEYYCCGRKLTTLKSGNLYCEVCGEEYEA